MADQAYTSRIVLVCSYPRSGSNWVGQVLRLAESYHARIDPDRMCLFHDLEVVRTQADPAAFGQPVDAPIVFFKSHELPSVLFERSPTLLGNLRHAVNIVRHPLDVIASTFRWMVHAGHVEHEGRAVCNVEEAISLGLLDEHVDDFLTYGGSRRLASWGYGTWRAHVAEWGDEWGGDEATGVPIVRARYRDLVADPLGAFGRLARAVGMEAEDKHLAKAIEACTPERVGAGLGAGFVHRASDRTFDDTLSPEQIERGLEVFAPEIERFGL